MGSDESEDEVVEVSDEREEEVIEGSDESEEDSEDSEDMDSTATNKFLEAINVELAGSCCGCDGGAKAVKVPCSSNSECLSGCCEKKSGKCGNCKGCPSFAKKCMPCVPGESEEDTTTTALN